MLVTAATAVLGQRTYALPCIGPEDQWTTPENPSQSSIHAFQPPVHYEQVVFHHESNAKFCQPRRNWAVDKQQPWKQMKVSSPTSLSVDFE